MAGDQPVELGHHVAHAGQVGRVRGIDGLGEPSEGGLGDVVAQLGHQLLERLPCTLVVEVVVLQRRELAGRVGRHAVQLRPPLVGGHLVIGELQGGALELGDLPQLLGDPLEGALQAHPVQLRLPRGAQPFTQGLQPVEAAVDAALEQLLDGPLRVHPVQQVVGDLGQDLVG